jgi:two-component system, chemotaxis family, CheB/CheR fusion protein
MTVLQVEDQMPVQPNHIYVIPPNMGMRLQQGTLVLTERVGAGVHLPIDEFFRSLAAAQGSRSIAVVLSGTASDGTLGLKAVKAAGGITFAQDETAKFDSMPRNAIGAGCVDLVLPPQLIAHEIARLSRHPYVITRPDESAPALPEGPVAPGNGFNEILHVLRASTGVDFSLYKPGTLHRRILRDDNGERHSLFHDILISVTGFFREPATFEGLKTSVFPAILRDRVPADPLRLWVPGCATGEEPYSLAICLLEYMQSAGIDIPLQIFGTDLSEPALARARAGSYPESVAVDVSPDRLRRFFVKVDGRYLISRLVRDKCIFAQQNLIKDPPFSKLDLITCRNLLIYLGPALQARAMQMFHYGLKPDGFLVLGLSETVGSASQSFQPVDKKLKIYSRVAGIAPAAPHQDFKPPEAVRAADPLPPAPRASSATQSAVDHYLRNHYSPAGVLIDAEMNILQVHGRTAPFLKHPTGAPAANLKRILRKELVSEFRKLFDRCRQKRLAVRGAPIRVTYQNRALQVIICVSPLTSGAADPPYLVLFEERSAIAPSKASTASDRKGADGVAKRVRGLEGELASAKQYLKSLIEEHQASSEELKSANEEVLSSNEELQSTNEELLTAKEELQSTNEELTTVDDEMHSRIVDLTRLNGDLDSLLTSVNIPIVMVSHDLRIRRFTPQAERVLNLLPADIGRPLGDLRSKIHVPDLEQLLQDAIESLTVKERQVQDRDGRWFSMRIRPYRTRENRIDGAVMVLVDITERKEEFQARYWRLFHAAHEGIIQATEAGEIIDLNPYIVNTFGISRSASIGVKFWGLEVFRDANLDSRTLRQLLDSEFLHKDVVLATRARGRLKMEISGHVFWEDEKRIVQINLQEVGQRRRESDRDRRLEAAAEESTEVDAIGRLAGSIGRDFNNLLTAVGGYAQLLKRDLPAGNPLAQDAERISAALERATLLTRQVLALGQKHPSRPTVWDLNALMREIESIIRATIPGRIELRIELDPGLRPVQAESGRMKQTILNLIRHARRAVPGEGTLSIVTRNSTIDEAYAHEHPAVSPGEYVVLEVSGSASSAGATGPPVLESLLSAGRQEREALSVADIYDTVRRSGGCLWAASELGRGNTFRIFLPPAAPHPERIVEAPASGVLENGSETVLLVEPDEMVRGLMARVLLECGYTVWEADRGSQALERLRQSKEPAHLLVTEMVMPDMTGPELAGQIAALRPEMRVLFLSGFSEDVIESNGASGYEPAPLLKPFTVAALSRRVRQALQDTAQP